MTVDDSVPLMSVSFASPSVVFKQFVDLVTTSIPIGLTTINGFITAELSVSLLLSCFSLIIDECDVKFL